MKKNIKNSIKVSLLTAVVLAMGFPAFSYASTYAYVNQFGQMNTVVADTPAMAIAIAPGIATNSGVVLMSNSTGVVLGANTSATYGATTYAYVNQAGTVVTVSANSPATAFANAFGISENSGVVLLNNVVSTNSGIVGDHVSGI